MGMRFRKSVNLGKHFRINLSSKGIGYSYGTKGYRHTVSADGKERITTSIPGTGLSSTKYINSKSSAKKKNNTVNQSKVPRESLNEKYIRTRGNVSLYAILSVIFILSAIVSCLFLLPAIYALVFAVLGITFAIKSIGKRGECKKLESQINDEPEQDIKLNIAENGETSDKAIEDVNHKPSGCDVMPRSNTQTSHNQHAVQEKKETPESEKDYYNLLTILSHPDIGDCILLYRYEENICFIDNTADVLHGHGGEALIFIKEPDNTYDKNAVAIYLDNNKIGYVYRGKVQDMINDWYNRGEPVRGHINRIDTANNKASYKIGFYRPIDYYDYRTFKLIYINKKVDEYNKRSDYLVDCEAGDYVSIQLNYSNLHYYVYTTSGYEIGELGKGFEEYSRNTDYRIIFGVIGNLNITSEKIICNINVYLI